MEDYPMITRKLGLGLLTLSLLAGLSACTDKVEDCDTAAGEACGDTDEADADTDADADSDTDTDADADAYFEPYAVIIDWVTAYDDGAYGNWVNTDGSDGQPFMSMTIYEEAYFDAGDERYSCTYNATFNEVAIDNMGIEDLWYGAEVELVDSGNTDCTNLNPDDWGATDPSGFVVDNRFAVGFGPLGPTTSGDLEPAVIDAGLDWDVDWAPYVFSYYMGWTKDASVSFADSESTRDWGYVFAYEVADDLSLNTDADGNLVGIDAGGGSEMPDNSLVSGNGFYYLDSESFK
ncbi:MAG: hypothetical protein ACI9VR_003980 [Cognaticolwellia sp.]|jgi:hypothetical protein